ncbi:MAG: endonuclease III [Sandaracinaceae bacterium]|nr:endonuclease III [Sandaracinaceae bacterium]
MTTTPPPPVEVQKQADDVRKRLAVAIPKPVVELDHENAWQLLVATILAAQATDKKINEITPALFARYPTPADLAAADLAEVQELVKQSGFFREKAKRIIGAAQVVTERFGGEVPKTMAKLTQVPGAARKTANVVLGMAYRKPTGVVVDTHVTRLAARLELSVEDTPEKIERELMTLFPKRSWIDTSHRLILHGRYVCKARFPRCGRCPLHEICAVAEGKKETRGWKERAAWEQRLVESKGAVDEL